MYLHQLPVVAILVQNIVHFFDHHVHQAIPDSHNNIKDIKSGQMSLKVRNEQKFLQYKFNNMEIMNNLSIWCSDLCK